MEDLEVSNRVVVNLSESSSNELKAASTAKKEHLEDYW